MSPTSSFALGSLIGILGILGLFLAARAHDPQMYVVGLVFAIFAVLFDFWLIKRWFDRKSS
ncbi:MAG: hypothetical protein IT561_03325 [Alphaproteobacteria bacterium]|nr:hypothetical protein [Alphaproteobacteria bacterium]